MDHDPDRDLIACAIGGEQTALERLLLAHYDRLLRRIGRRLPASLRGVTAAEDILQETFLAAFEHIGSFAPRGRFSFFRWLATIADRQLLDAVKAHNAQKRGGDRHEVRYVGGVDQESVTELIDLVAGDDLTPSRMFSRNEAAAAIQVGLACVPPDHRQAIQLRYFRGLPVADVAKMMNRTPHAVHNLCHRALKELRVVLGRSSQYLTRH